MKRKDKESTTYPFEFDKAWSTVNGNKEIVHDEHGYRGPGAKQCLLPVDGKADKKRKGESKKYGAKSVSGY